MITLSNLSQTDKKQDPLTWFIKKDDLTWYEIKIMESLSRKSPLADIFAKSDEWQTPRPLNVCDPTSFEEYPQILPPSGKCFPYFDWIARIEELTVALEGSNLNNVNLFNANLEGSNLNSADLSHANLESSYLNSADLSHANLESANLFQTDLSRSNLESANLESSYLNSARLFNTRLYNINLNNSSLLGANIVSADLFHANLNNSNLKNANLNNSNLNNANLINVKDLTQSQILLACNWYKAIFKGHYDPEKYQWIVDDAANNQYIEELKQYKDSDPKELVDCSIW